MINQELANGAISQAITQFAAKMQYGYFHRHQLSQDIYWDEDVEKPLRKHVTGRHKKPSSDEIVQICHEVLV